MTRYAALLVLSTRAFAQTDWPSYGNDPGAMRYSPLRQIRTDNIERLKLAWTFRTGKPGAEAVPIVVDGVMYLTAPDGVYAIVPETGEFLWKYEAAPSALRGLAYWKGTAGLHSRVFAGNGPFLLSLDVTTGKPAPGFGNEGRVNLKEGVLGDLKDGRYALDSPPAVFGDVVITGCANGEGSPAAGAYGDIRGWDARTGKLLWTFHTVPRPGEPGAETWPAGSWKNRSGTNVWGFFTLDVKRGIVYAPLGSPTSDFYGADRIGDGLYGNSLVALDARTGEKKWHRQLVHHDLWDYDLAAPPALFDIHRDGRVIPAVAQITKMGLLFVFDRVTGEPVYGMEERPVPQTSIPGEITSKTQPFPVKPPPLAKNTFRLEELYDRSPEHARFCKELFDSNQMKIGPPYTPLPLEGNSLFFPSTLGGGNWGGVSVDPSQRPAVRQCDERGTVGAHGEARDGVRSYLRVWALRPILGSRDAHPLPESAIRRTGRGGSGDWRHCMAFGAGANRSAGGRRRAKHRVAEYRTAVSPRLADWSLSAPQTIPDSARSIPKAENCCGNPSSRRAGTPARSLIGTRRPTIRRPDGRRGRSVPGRRPEQYTGGLRAPGCPAEAPAGFGHESGSGCGRGAARTASGRQLCSGAAACGRRESAGRENLRYRVSFGRGRDQPADECDRLGCHRAEHGGAGSAGVRRGRDGHRRIPEQDARPVGRQKESVCCDSSAF